MWQRLPLLLALLVVLSGSPSRLAARPDSDARCFSAIPGVKHCVDSLFRFYWEQNGGLPVFGYPTGRRLPEETPEGLFQTQHFERNRLELHPENSAPYDVLLGRLGAERLAQLGRSPVPASPARPREGCRYFNETGHNLCGAFRSYWRTHGLDLGESGVSYRESLALFGFPLSEPAMETNASGDTVLTQWFERARFEYHPDNPEPYKVLLGLLDQELRAARTPAPPAAGWVEVSGSQLVQQGRPIYLKGVNYYPAQHPWGYMWTEWDGPAVARELARARRELGINTVRVLVPYRQKEGWSDNRGNVNAAMLSRLRQLVQIAGDHQLKVIITLFDWYDGSIKRAQAEREYNRRYLRTIVSAFKDDDRVLAWDIHNEPDNYPTWEAGEHSAVVDWLAAMAQAIRAIDSRHLLTVGVGRVESLWAPSSRGRTIADISDFISIHSYDAGSFAAQMAEVRKRTDKPVLLEEFGWPSGPKCRGRWYNEHSQLYLYREALNAVRSQNLAGLLGWWLQDPPRTRWESVDENGHFGLYRHDGTPKPALGPFRSFRVPPLPSRADTGFRVTAVTRPEVSEVYQPRIFDDGIVLRGEFKHFWRFFGGQPMFGRPITNAYRNAQGKVVQYFERARLELDEDEFTWIDPRKPELEKPEVYLARIDLTALGRQALGERSFPRVADPGRPEVLYFPGTGHTLSGAFRDLWETQGEAFFGPPLTEVFEEEVDGRTRLVQYFPYWRFEKVGDGPVQTSPLGRWALEQRQCPGQR